MIRDARPDDLCAFPERALPSWCAEWRGWVYERDGEPVAIGSVCRDRQRRAVCFFDARGPVPAIVMHRTATRALRWLRGSGATWIIATCDETRPRAADWLRRLGFRPTELVVPGLDTVVWECDLST